MSLTNNQWKALGLLTTVILTGLVAVTAYGVFRGQSEVRITANEKSIEQMEPKIESLVEHAARSETDMEWMKKTVEDYDEKQEVVLSEIRALKQP